MHDLLNADQVDTVQDIQLCTDRMHTLCEACESCDLEPPFPSSVITSSFFTLTEPKLECAQKGEQTFDNYLERKLIRRIYLVICKTGWDKCVSPPSRSFLSPVLKLVTLKNG